MRFRALQDLGYKEIEDSWVKKANELTEKQKQEFIIKDNVSFGEWNWDDLANEWDLEDLGEWGLDVNYDVLVEPDFKDLTSDLKNKPATMKITFESPEQLQKAEIDIKELLDRKYGNAYYSVSAGEI